MSNTQLEELLVGQPADVQAEIIRINTEARPIALQIALLVPLGAGLIGLLTSFGMMRQKDIKPSVAVEGMATQAATRPVTGPSAAPLSSSRHVPAATVIDEPPARARRRPHRWLRAHRGGARPSLDRASGRVRGDRARALRVWA